MIFLKYGIHRGEGRNVFGLRGKFLIVEGLQWWLL